MKGILLAGSGSTLPVHDRPAIYYPLSLLMLAGIRDILLFAMPSDLPVLDKLFGDGSPLGLALLYRAHDGRPGSAAPLRQAAEYLSGGPCFLVTGDTFFLGDAVAGRLAACAGRGEGCRVFACPVADPGRHPVVKFDPQGAVVAVEEKSPRPGPGWAVPGLGVYDGRLAEIAGGAQTITDIHRAYLMARCLTVTPWGRGMTWLDLGPPEARMTAALVVQALEQSSSSKVACLEEIALRGGFIGPPQFERLVKQHGDTAYGRYLRRVLREHLGEQPVLV
jgi:glucose-1-phosphate thymidylyltransferase